MKRLFYAANTILAIVAGVDCFAWGLKLSPSTILWYDGQVSGYFFLTLLSIVVTGFCLLPSLMISEWD
jgi:hypothetical protein